MLICFQIVQLAPFAYLFALFGAVSLIPFERIRIERHMAESKIQTVLLLAQFPAAVQILERHVDKLLLLA